jgi:hypothetical protein
MNNNNNSNKRCELGNQARGEVNVLMNYITFSTAPIYFKVNILRRPRKTGDGSMQYIIYTETTVKTNTFINFQAATENRPRKTATKKRPREGGHVQEATENRPREAGHGKQATENRPREAGHGKQATENRPRKTGHG